MIVNGSAAADTFSMSVAAGVVNVSRTGGAMVKLEEADGMKGGTNIALNLAPPPTA
jgi:hypothetical protein